MIHVHVVFRECHENNETLVTLDSPIRNMLNMLNMFGL